MRLHFNSMTIFSYFLWFYRWSLQLGKQYGYANCMHKVYAPRSLREVIAVARM